MAMDNISVHGPYCGLRPCWYLWSILLSNVMLVFMVLPQPGALLMPVFHVTTRGHMDVYSLCWHLKPFWYLWSMMPQVAMLPPRDVLIMSMVSAATRDHTEVHGSCRLDARGHLDVCGPYCHQKPGGSSWPMLLLTVKVKKVSFAVVSMTADSQLRMRDIEASVTTSPCSITLPPKKKPLKRTLKNCARNVEV